MRCKRHTVDSSSSIGVCASCLRERLFSLAASTAAYEDSLAYPNIKFFATPQVNTTGGGGSSSSWSEKLFETNRSFKKKQTGLSQFSTFFRTRTNDFSSPTKCSSPSSWFSKVLSRKQSTCYIEDLIASTSNHRHSYCKGMSPANGLESVEESPGRARRTSPAMGTPGRRRKTATTMGLCLSPLVRAKPNCSFGYTTGEMKSPVKSFCANRSKKLADLGRADHRR